MFLRVLTIAVSVIATVASDDPKESEDHCKGDAGAFCGERGTCFHDGAYGCKCNPGYENRNGDRITCVDINECDMGWSNCAPEDKGGFCVNTFPNDPNFPKWKCGCSHEEGYKNGLAFDVDHGPTECILGCNEDCGLNAKCTFDATDETYSCVCDAGFEFDGDGCISSKFLRAPSAMPSISSRPSQIPVDDISPLVCYETDVMNTIYSQNFTFDDLEWSNAKYDASAELGRYMGPFQKDDKHPSRKFNIPAGLTRVIISFDAIELDSWDGGGSGNGPDELSITINSAVATTEVELGSFHYGITEKNIVGGDSTFSFSVTTTSNRENLGGLEHYKDQTHHVTVVLGHAKFSSSGEELDVTIGFVFSGDVDESLGIDNFEVKSCVTTLMTPAPTNPATNPPTNQPTDPATNPPTNQPTDPPTTSSPTQHPTTSNPTASPAPTTPSAFPTISRSPTPKPTFGIPTASPEPSIAPSKSPTPAPTTPPTPAPTTPPTPAPSDCCVDYVDWIDCGRDGCEWYEEDPRDRCSNGVDNCPDDNGVTAREACCVCGGGTGCVA